MHIALETICIKVTTKCNLTCNHCWANSTLPALEMDCVVIMNFLDSLKPLGLKHVSVSGGEPSLYSQGPLLLRQLCEHGYDVSVTTNGTFPKKIIDLISAVPKALTQQLNIRVSIDGWKSLHEDLRGRGTFDLAIQTATDIAAILGCVSLNTVVFSPPIRLAELVSSLPTKAIQSWALITPVIRDFLHNPLCDSNESLENIDLWRKEISELLPSATVRVWDYLSHPNGGLVVETDGSLIMPGVDSESDIIIGNIAETTPKMVEDQIRNRMDFDPIAFFTLNTKS